MYLLDDPLSAVDTKVAKHIFNKCILEHLSEKTVVLVTHAVHVSACNIFYKWSYTYGLEILINYVNIWSVSHIYGGAANHIRLLLKIPYKPKIIIVATHTRWTTKDFRAFLWLNKNFLFFSIFILLLLITLLFMNYELVNLSARMRNLLIIFHQFSMVWIYCSNSFWRSVTKLFSWKMEESANVGITKLCLKEKENISLCSATTLLTPKLTTLWSLLTNKNKLLLKVLSLQAFIKFSFI